MSLNPVEAAFGQDTWFSTLPLDIQEQLVRIGQRRKYQAGQRLFSRGDPPNGLWRVVEGRVIVFNEIQPGHDGVLAYFGASAWFGDIALADGLGRTHSVEASEDTVVFCFPQKPLMRLLEEHPQFWKWIALLLTQKLRVSFVVLDELAKIPAEVRLARRILLMATGVGVHTNEPKLDLDIQQEHLAQMLGMSRTSVNPILQNLSNSGMLSLNYGRIRILDMKALMELAGYAHWQPIV